MIERYTLPAMAEVFSETHRLSTWLDVELAACEACEMYALVPSGTASRIRQRATIDADRAREIEADVHHDVIAFLTMVGESVGDEARFLHHGLTSSDLVDSALAVTLRQAAAVLCEELDRVRETLCRLAVEHRQTLCMGRTHGVHAEPITFGLKALGWATEVRRAHQRLRNALEEAAVGKLSGAVGNFAHLPPEVETEFCARLGITAEPVATQVVARDRLASLLGAIALVGASLERIALDIRLSQRTECGELFEPFGSSQKGSSAMPHKRNPILCERICGIARLLRSYAHAALDNVALWEERDISHSSVERVIVPDAFQAAHYSAATLNRVLCGLDVRVDRMRQNLETTRGLIYSQRVLLALVGAGVSREQAYATIQTHAAATLAGGPDFRHRTHEDPEVAGVLGDALEACFDSDSFLTHLNTLFERGLAAADAPPASDDAVSANYPVPLSTRRAGP